MRCRVRMNFGRRVAAIVTIIAPMLALGSGTQAAAEIPNGGLDLIAAFIDLPDQPATTVIDLATAAGRAHLGAGWSAPETLADGTVGVRLVGAPGEILFMAGPSTVSRVAEVDIDLPENAPSVPFAVSCNGMRVEVSPAERTPRAWRLALSEKVLRPGLNRLALAGRMPERAPLSGVLLRGARFTGARLMTPRGRAAAAVDGDRLLLPAGASVDYYLRAPAGSRLLADALDGAVDGLHGDLTRDGTAAIPLPLTSLLSATGAPLAGADGSVVRLTLRADPGGAGIVLSRPRVRPVDAAPTTPRALTDRPPLVVLYVADTLRADRLGVYGYPRPTSPRLDAFAATAVRFADAQAASSWTRPSTASILTGTLPQRHGAITLRDQVAASVRTWPELLHAAGYRTGAVVTNVNVGDRFGFGRGFDTYEYLPEDLERNGVYVPASELHARGLAWLAALPSQPTFLYLHATDAHAPYRPAEPWRMRFAHADLRPTIGVDFAVGNGDGAALQPDDVATLSDRYDAEIAGFDAAFGDLLDALASRDRLRDALVVFVGDHGEEFRDHHGLSHGHTLYDEVTRVPLLVKLPGGRGGGTVVEATVRQVDVLPTILALLGLPLPEGIAGRPLLDAAGTVAAPPDLEAIAIARMNTRGLVGLTTREWKVILPDGGPPEVYDRLREPAARINVAPAHPVLLGYVRQRVNGLDPLARAADPAMPPALDPALVERLRALGYLNH